MAGLSKRIRSSWVSSDYGVMKTATDTITTLPDVLYPNASTATVGLKGQAVQSTTPTPDSPIIPQGCGDLETVGAKAGQYKIPISSANITTPVYLGEVRTTRKIKKLVFDGTESWNRSTFGNNTRVYTPQIPECMSLSLAICTRFDYNVANVGYPRIGEFVINSSKAIIFGIDGNTFAGVDAWKSYLAAQYAAGTPVCVWYVLATEETAVVNEPLMKIGEYADEVSGITIPTIAGANALSVDTTVQPSEVTVNYKGWHPAIVHERTNGAWT